MTSNPPSVNSEFPIAILGAGFSGVGMGIKLKQAGIHSFTIFERAGEVGGTWRDNTYPGAGCDVHSHLYCYSFAQNPDWSRAFSGWREIQDYIVDITDRYSVRPHIRFNKEVVGTRFDEATGLWTVEFADGETFKARAVISAAGGLANPAYPKIKGLKSFKGKLMHTARWDNDFSLKGKKVGMIGSGASAIQAGPPMAKDAKHLTVFQRTPHWIIPKGDREITGIEKKLFETVPPLMWARRWALYWMYEARGPLIISNKPWLKKIAKTLGMAHLRKQLKDPALRRACTPDYQFGCKRVLISNDWYPMLERDNVTLETTGIERITPKGVVTADGGEHELDVLIMATGFQVSISEAPFDIRGRNNLGLDEAWDGGAEAYKGITVSGFPNLFFMLGPNTGPGHNSVLVYTEMQIDYALQAIEKLRDEDIKYLDVKQDVQDDFNAEMQKRMQNTSWTSGCNSWYLSEDGKNSTLYPGLNIEYRWRTRALKTSEYEVAAWGGGEKEAARSEVMQETA